MAKLVGVAGARTKGLESRLVKAGMSAVLNTYFVGLLHFSSAAALYETSCVCGLVFLGRKSVKGLNFWWWVERNGVLAVIMHLE